MRRRGRIRESKKDKAIGKARKKKGREKREG